MLYFVADIPRPPPQRDVQRLCNEQHRGEQDGPAPHGRQIPHLSRQHRRWVPQTQHRPPLPGPHARNLLHRLLPANLQEQ